MKKAGVEFSFSLSQFACPTVDSRVVALTMSGEELWVSPSLDGVTPGTPVISENGEFVFLTHNSDGETVGHFTILSGSSGQVFFNETDLGAPFAPLGIHYNPAEGYYDGGQNNRNDILVWSVQPKPSDTSVGPGATFAFQFPIGFSGNPDGLSYTPLGTTVKDFQAIQKPIFTNEGRTMYWGNSRSQFRCWIGAPGVNQNRFSRGRTAILGFSRGDPPRQAVFAPPVLSHNESDLYVFGATAAKEFVRMNADFSDEILVATTSQVKTQAHVSPDDAFVYYVEGNGQVHQARTEDLVDNWIFDLGKPVEGSSALNENGTILYVADATGLVKALRIGDVPTNAPTTAPSNLPTVAPSWVPTSNPTSRPTEGSTPTPSQVEPTFNGSKLIGGNPNDDSSETDTSGGSEVVLTSVLMLLIPFFLL